MSKEKAGQMLAFEQLGTMTYEQVFRRQEQLLSTIVAAKLARRKGNIVPYPPHWLLFCYHPPVVTLGNRAEKQHLISTPEELTTAGITLYETNRGGDITYHGPGQLVVYPILDLELVCKDVGRYMRGLEEVAIRTLAEYGVRGQRIEKLTGVWVQRDNQAPEKIAAIGLRCTHWVSMHGLAFNLQTNLSHFEHIVPCGITDKSVTSLHKILNTEQIDLRKVEDTLLFHFAEHFRLTPFSYLKQS